MKLRPIHAAALITAGNAAWYAGMTVAAILLVSSGTTIAAVQVARMMTRERSRCSVDSRRDA